MTGRAHKIQVQQEVQICVDYSHERIPPALVLPCTCQMKRSRGTRAAGRGGVSVRTTITVRGTRNVVMHTCNMCGWLAAGPCSAVADIVRSNCSALAIRTWSEDLATRPEG